MADRFFDGLGLRGVDVTRIVSVVAGFVRGAAKAVSDASTAEQATGLSDDEWWNARAPLLTELVGDHWPTRFPTMTRLAAEQAFDQADRPPGDVTPYTVRDAQETFEFGLQRLLDGIEAYIVSGIQPGPVPGASEGPHVAAARRVAEAGP